MTKQEFIKFKKEIKKEDAWFNTCSFYMTSRQKALHTATVALVYNGSYEKEIEYYRSLIERVNGYNTWTQEEKEMNEKYSLEGIARYKSLLAQFNTPENEAIHRIKQLKNTDAFKKLATLGVTVELTLENDIFYARFHY